MEASFTNSSAFPNYSAPNMTGMDWTCKELRVDLIWETASIITVVLGLPANMKVLHILLRNTANSSTSDILTLNLAVLDTFFCLMTSVFIIGKLVMESVSVLTALIFFFNVKNFGSPLFLCCICVDRYLAVLHPITFIRLRDRKYPVGSSAAVWALSIIYSSCSSFVNMKYKNEMYTAFLTTAFTVIVFCNLSILRALRQSGPGRDEIHPMKKKAFKMVLNILVSVIISYFPGVFALLFQNISKEIFCYFSPIGMSFVMMSAFIQPLSYLSITRKMICSTK